MGSSCADSARATRSMRGRLSAVFSSQDSAGVYMLAGPAMPVADALRSLGARVRIARAQRATRSVAGFVAREHGGTPAGGGSDIWVFAGYEESSEDGRGSETGGAVGDSEARGGAETAGGWSEGGSGWGTRCRSRGWSRRIRRGGGSERERAGVGRGQRVGEGGGQDGSVARGSEGSRGKSRGWEGGDMDRRPPHGVLEWRDRGMWRSGPIQDRDQRDSGQLDRSPFPEWSGRGGRVWSSSGGGGGSGGSRRGEGEEEWVQSGVVGSGGGRIGGRGGGRRGRRGVEGGLRG